MIHLGSISAIHQIKHNTGHLQNGSVSLYICNRPPTIPESSNCTRTATWLCAHPILSMSAGSPFDTHLPVGLQCSGFIHMTCTHPAPYSLLLVQKVHWAHTGTPGCGSQHVSPCSVTPLAGAQLPMSTHGEETPLGPGWGGDSSGVTSGSVMLRLDCCSVTTFHSQVSPSSQNVMLLYSCGQTDSISQKSLCNSLITV